MTQRAMNRLRRTEAFMWLLAAIPVANSVLDQVNNAFHLGIGPMSLLQIVNGGLLLLFAAALLAQAVRHPQHLQRIPLAVPGALLLLATVCTVELVRSGSLSMASLAPYGQMVYWLLLWAVTASFVQEPRAAARIMTGLTTGAVITAVSVFLGLAFHTRQYYSADAVTSSAGWFDTAKMITGVLLTGALLLLYQGRVRRRLLCNTLASLCFAACVLTYARAGWVALAVVVAWLGFWALLFAPSKGRRWLAPFFVLCFSGLGIVVLIVGPAQLTARWSDVGQGDEAGSGRAAFWKIAADRYLEAPVTVQVFGRGYVGMADMLLQDYGLDIRHTHNDFLDMATVGGLLGVLWLLLLLSSMLEGVLRFPLQSMEGAIAGAVLLTYLCHGQFTGQLWGTGVMGYYTVALACLAVRSPVTNPEAELIRANSQELRPSIGS